nr:hypothetical protein [Pandoravirus massiliensis]
MGKGHEKKSKNRCTCKIKVVLPAQPRPIFPCPPPFIPPFIPPTPPTPPTPVTTVITTTSTFVIPAGSTAATVYVVGGGGAGGGSPIDALGGGGGARPCRVYAARWVKERAPHQQRPTRLRRQTHTHMTPKVAPRTEKKKETRQTTQTVEKKRKPPKFFLKRPLRSRPIRKKVHVPMAYFFSSHRGEDDPLFVHVVRACFFFLAQGPLQSSGEKSKPPHFATYCCAWPKICLDIFYLKEKKRKKRQGTEKPDPMARPPHCARPKKKWKAAKERKKRETARPRTWPTQAAHPRKKKQLENRHRLLLVNEQKKKKKRRIHCAAERTEENNRRRPPQKKNMPFVLVPPFSLALLLP